MPARVIDTAVVEFLPDLSGFDRVLERELDDVMKHVTRSADEAADDIEDSFIGATRDIEHIFDDMGDSAVIDFGRLSESAERAATEMGNDFQRNGEVAEHAVDEFRRSADRSLNEVAVHSAATTSAIGGQFSKLGLLGSAAMFGIGAAATAGLGALTVMGLKSAASFEQTQISFNALLGSTEAGQRVFKQLQDFAAQTPFEFPEIADAGKRFLAFDESVGLTDDGLQDYLTTIGNVISVTGGGAESFGRINLAIGQIGSASKVTLENLNQIADAIPGFSPIQAIAKGLGVSTAEAMDMISSGAIPAAQGVQLLLDGMKKFPGAAGAMEMQSQTLLGVFSTFTDVIGQSLAEAFKPVIPQLKDTITQLTPIIGEALSAVAPLLGDLLVTFLPIISDLIKGIVPILTPILRGLATAFERIGPVLEPLGEALGLVLMSLEPIWPVVGELIATLVTGLVPVIQELAPLVGDLAPTFVDLIVALMPVIPTLTDFLVILLQLVTPILKAQAALLDWVILKALVPVINAWAKAVAKVLGPVRDFAHWLNLIDWGHVGQEIGDAFSTAWGAVVAFFVGIGHFFANLPGQVLDFIKSLPERFVAIIGKMFDLGFQAIGLGIGLLIVGVMKLPGLIMGAIITLPQLLGNFFITLWDGAVDLAAKGVTKIIQWFKDLGPMFIAATIALPGIIGNFFVNMWNGAVNIAKNAVEAIIGFFTNLPSRLGGFAASVGQGIVDFIKNFLNRAIDNINSGIARVDSSIPGVDLPRLPRLAHGGIFSGPAIVGENSSTAPEAAIPLGDARAMSMLRDALGTSGPAVTFGPGAVVVNVNGSVSAQQAETIGQSVGRGIASVLNRSDIRTAVRAS